MPYREADLSRLTTIPVAGRRNKVEQRLLASPPRSDRSFSAFIDSLPVTSTNKIQKAKLADFAVNPTNCFDLRDRKRRK